MPYKERLTTVHILLSLRQELMRARDQEDSSSLPKIESIVDFLLDLAYQHADRGHARILEQLQDSIRDSHMGVPGKSDIPSTDDIRALDPTAARYPAITATIIRRAQARHDRRPPELGYAPDGTGEYRVIDPDWLAVAHAHGPYRDTFDLLCYMADGTLASFYEFDKLDIALDYAAQKCGIQQAEWEVCEIEVSDPKGRPNWLITP